MHGQTLYVTKYNTCMQLPKVNFYILPTQSEQGRQLFACKLAEKAFRLGFKSYILTNSMQQAQQMDNILWTFRASSFVPHEIFQDGLPSIANAVIIGTQQAPAPWQHTLINLSTVCPEQLDQAEQIFELLDNDETQKQAGRLRYRHYQTLGITPNTHKM
ncbi:DNA polymerase III subunit chi [Bathymodiolus japonicus methanotrophic gill symbiont]|uniref:DNA polymerase III subunit chi n=1 Tax=Bathymodiolus japonicus methanotrophic gill symbiont TaxID=113269 RepID=UPI001B403C43|nr:DNA polymerase III subunit chi [Bathymodiolus japonicus methanotrophic gill symbiont]GFO71202.1 DNA polymerase III subunit chi [Bathymodiolus japonicus methanotrophic gill symbiont]